VGAKKGQRHGHIIVKSNVLILNFLLGMGIFFWIMAPGTELVYKASVYGVQLRNNVSLISYSNNFAPGKA
jgi:hypothetical protein